VNISEAAPQAGERRYSRHDALDYLGSDVSLFGHSAKMQVQCVRRNVEVATEPYDGMASRINRARQVNAGGDQRERVDKEPPDSETPTSPGGSLATPDTPEGRQAAEDEGEEA
jgi:hypothetical protein